MRHPRGLAGLLVLVILLAGCGGGGTVSPGPNPPPPAPPAPPPPPPPPSPVDVVLDAAPLSPAGGTLKVTKAGSPLNGLSIAVPSGAFAGATQWTVSEMKEVRPTLPARTRQVGPTIRIRNGQGMGDRAFTLTIPARVSPDSGVAAFFRDPDTGTLELIPLVARTDSSLVVVTRHVSAGQLVRAGSAPALHASGSASAAPALGEVEILTVAAAMVDLIAEIRSDYRPGVDDWEFANRGSYIATGGYCAGSTISSLYHNYVRKVALGPLFGRYDDTDAFESDNPRGIRLASVIQKEIQWDAVLSQLLSQSVQTAAASVGTTAGGAGWAPLQAQTLGLAMLTTGHAQLLGIYRPGWLDGHSIVTQGVVQGSIYVSDPNVPGVERTLTYDGLGFTPFPFSANADLPDEIYTDVFVMGMSAMIPMSRVGELWDQVDNVTVGDAEFPSMHTQYLDPVALDTVWRDLAGEIKTASGTLLMRNICPACAPVRVPPADPKRAVTLVLSPAGTIIGGDPDDDQNGAVFPVAVGKSKLGLLQDALTPRDQNGASFAMYVNFAWFDVDRVPFKLLRSRFQGITGQEITWSVDNGGVGASGATYRWTFSPDSTPIVTPFNTTSVRYRHTTKGVYKPKVELFDGTGVRIAVDSGSLAIAEGYHWRMDCAEVKSDNPHANFSGAERTAYQRWLGYMSRLPGAPTDGFLSLLTPTTFRTFASFFAVAQPEQGATARQLPLFPGDSIDSPALDTRVYTGTTTESPSGALGFSKTYHGGVHDNIFGADMLTNVNFSVSGAGWGRGTLVVQVWGFSPAITLRFYARRIWEPNPAPAPPCSFGTSW